MKIPFFAVPAAILALSMMQPAYANRVVVKPKIAPDTFVGTVANCGVAGSDIVESAWVKDFGLPDASGRANMGLLLSKNGLTSDCSAAGAQIKGVAGITFAEIGFDCRTSLHCGAGAPRFNVVTNVDAPGVVHFGSCTNSTQTLLPQAGWTRCRINGAQMFPPIPTGAKIVYMDITFDEGTDQGTGLAIIDNIEINGVLVDK